MASWYFIRHGETDWNLQSRWQGQADVPLNERGLQQAYEISEKLAHTGIETIYSSDLIRARQTAEILAARLNISTVHYDRRLREIDQGVWQGLSIDEIHDRYREEFNRRLADPWSVSPPGGETAQQVKTRLESCLAEVRHDGAGKNAAFVTHGFAIAVILTQYNKTPLTSIWDLVPENGSISRIELEDG